MGALCSTCARAVRVNAAAQPAGAALRAASTSAARLRPYGASKCQLCSANRTQSTTSVIVPAVQIPKRAGR
jgi:hypothetical protein